MLLRKFYHLFKTLRWRVTPTLIIYLLLGSASTAGLITFNYKLVLASIALISSYFCAVGINDISDFEIDKINLPGDKNRPLISGIAHKTDLIFLCIIASLIAVVSAVFINNRAAIYICISLLVNLIYSLPPIKISHRPIITPLFLPIGYVIIPFLIGRSIYDNRLSLTSLMLIVALYSIFVGRIILKDFRDREGDQKMGKKTFLLVYGKKKVLQTSAVAFSFGYILLLIILILNFGLLSTLTIFYFLLLLWTILLINNSHKINDEQLAIGLGAKIGNGLLITVLTIIVLYINNAPQKIIVISVIFLMILYGYNIYKFIKFPQSAVIAYKK